MVSTIKKTLKVDNLLEIISDLITSDRYRYSVHALERMAQRKVTRPEVLQILKKGHHEKIKDVYDEKFKTWNYAIRGKTIDKKELRIVISLDTKIDMIVITVIQIKKKEDCYE